MQQWDYERVVAFDSEVETLRQYGDDGWELAGVLHGEDTIFYFKRPRAESAYRGPLTTEPGGNSDGK